MRPKKAEAPAGTAIAFRREVDRALALYHEAVEAAGEAAESEAIRLNAAVHAASQLVGRASQKWRRYRASAH